MFFGTTPNIVGQYLQQEIKKHQPNRVFVLFAGNFVVEQLAANVSRKIEIHSTDVSLYSKAIGYGVTGQKYDIRLTEKIKSVFQLFGNLSEPLDISAQVIFFAEVAKNMSESKTKHAYYQGLNQEAQAHQKAYYQKIISKLKRFRDAVGHMTFYGIDACRLLPEIKEGDFVFYDPPVLLGDYEKMFRALEDCYDFTPEPYTIIDESLKIKHLTYLHQKGAKVYYRTNNPIVAPENYTEVFRYKYQYGKNYCLYSNDHHETFVGRFKPLREQAMNFPFISAKDEITANSKIEVISVKTSVVNHYRLMWVKKAQMTDSGFSFLVLADKKLIGILQVADGVKFGSDLALINSDPACPFSKYRRLSKLVLAICCTKPVLKMINNASIWEHNGFTTRCFSEHPVSMKYRSLFKLAKREEATEGNFEYCLIYQNRTKIAETYEDALRKWLKKDGKVLVENV